MSSSSSFPAEGVVREWRAADAVGLIALDDGSAVKIGASACKGGFVPLVGVRVRVLAAAPHPLGGMKATQVELAGDASAYDALVEKELPEPDDEHEAQLARSLGWFALLSTRAPGPGRAGARAVVEAALAALPPSARGAARVNLDAHRGISLERYDFQLFLGRCPLSSSASSPSPSSSLPAHAGFVALGGGIPGLELRLRDVRGPAYDPWAKDGKLRALLKLVRAFATTASVAFVHRPTSRGLVSAPSFLDTITRVHAADPLDDASFRPMRAVVDVIRDADGRLRTVGAELAALPDVLVDATIDTRGDLDDPRSAAHLVARALYAAVQRMADDNRVLAKNDRVVVDQRAFVVDDRDRQIVLRDA